MMKESLFGKANRAFTTKILAGIGGLLAAALSFAYSVYQGQVEGEVPKADPGKVIDAGRWNVTATSASLAEKMPDGSHASPGKKVLVVDLVLENRSAESSNIYRDVLKIENVADASTPQFYLMRDRALLWDVQPMMPEPVKAVWQVPQELALPARLKLTVVGATFKPKDNLYAAPGWFPTKPVAVVDLPIAPVGEAGR